MRGIIQAEAASVVRLRHHLGNFLAHRARFWLLCVATARLAHSVEMTRACSLLVVSGGSRQTKTMCSIRLLSFLVRGSHVQINSLRHRQVRRRLLFRGDGERRAAAGLVGERTLIGSK